MKQLFLFYLGTLLEMRYLFQLALMPKSINFRLGGQIHFKCRSNYYSFLWGREFRNRSKSIRWACTWYCLITAKT